MAIRANKAADRSKVHIAAGQVFYGVVGLVLCAAVFSATECGQDVDAAFRITTDTVLTEDIEIPFGETCVVKPGVTVEFEGYRTLLVRGQIIAVGTADQPIVFTSVDRPRGSKEKPTWKGFEIAGKQAHGEFRHCRFEGAFRNLVWESNPSFDSCEFVGNHYGLYCTRKAAPHVSFCRITRNTYGVASDFASPLLLDNTITENVIGVYLQLSSKALLGRNLIAGNQTDIKSEEAFGKNQSSVSLEYMWKVVRQLY